MQVQKFDWIVADSSVHIRASSQNQLFAVSVDFLRQYQLSFEHFHGSALCGHDAWQTQDPDRYF